MKKISRRAALKYFGFTAVAGALAACTPAVPTKAPEATKPAPTTAAEPAATSPGVAPTAAPLIEIKVSLWDIAYSFPEGEPDEIARMVSDRFNVKLTPVNVGWGDADEKYNTWAAAGQLPDVIGAIAMPGTARYYQWINDGVVRPLPDVSGYKEISRLLALPDVVAYAVDGNNYYLPRMCYEDPSWWCMDRGLIVRKDWMEKLGIADPKTEEDYIDMLVAFAKEDPDGNGQHDSTGFTPVGTWILFSEGWTGYGVTDGRRWMKEADGKWRLAIGGENAFRLAQFFRRMYAAGGLDPDFATLGGDQAIDKFAAGKAGMLGRQVSPKHLKKVMDAWVKVQTDKDFVDTITILHGPTVDGSYVRFSEMGYWSETYIEARVDDAKLERILQLYDWLYSKEGLYMMQYGIEFKDWELDNDGNVQLLTPVDPGTGLHTPTSELYPFTYAMSYLAAWTSDLLQYEDPAIPERLRKLCTAERDLRLAKWKDPQINWKAQGIDVPEKQEMAAVRFSDDWVKFIMNTSGAPDRELYDAMKRDWDANGYAAAVEAVTAKARELGL